MIPRPYGDIAATRQIVGLVTERTRILTHECAQCSQFTIDLCESLSEQIVEAREPMVDLIDAIIYDVENALAVMHQDIPDYAVLGTYLADLRLFELGGTDE